MASKQTKRRLASTLSSHFLIFEDTNCSNLESVDDYELGEVEVSDLWSGDPFDIALLANAKITMDRGKSTDILGNPMSWAIYSTRFVEAIVPIVGEQVQFLPLPIWLTNGTFNQDRYQIVNPLVVLDAIHNTGKRKEDVTLLELRLDGSKIPAGVHMFRLKHQPTTVVVSSEIVRCIEDGGFVGFVANALEVVWMGVFIVQR